MADHGTPFIERPRRHPTGMAEPVMNGLPGVKEGDDGAEVVGVAHEPDNLVGEVVQRRAQVHVSRSAAHARLDRVDGHAVAATRWRGSSGTRWRRPSRAHRDQAPDRLAGAAPR